MVKDYGLEWIKIPKDSKKGQATIYMSPNLETYKTILVLIQGTGDVRAG